MTLQQSFSQKINQTFPRGISFAIAFFVLLGTVAAPESGRSRVLAQTESFPPNPLESTDRDPLLPSIDRPLTDFERRRLSEAILAFDAEALALFQAGNAEEAFAIWYRAIRLSRSLGVMEEVKSLARVGQIAWENGRTEDVQFIRKRLRTIQQQVEAEGTMTPELLMAFGEAYQQLRSIDDSIGIAQQLLANSRDRGDAKTEEELLNTLGELYLSKFDYVQAADIYRQLLAIAQAKPDSLHEGLYLQKLAEIYHQSSQPENAVIMKEQLAENYLNSQQLQFLPNLKISIGSDYEKLQEAERASQNYQEAFSLALALQQFGAAGEALTKLGDLYQTYNYDDFALQIYQRLITVEQLSYNYYGLMNVYDKMGKIYLKQGNAAQALAAFNQGLELARALSYREDYFLAQIQQVQQGGQ